MGDAIQAQAVDGAVASGLTWPDGTPFDPADLAGVTFKAGPFIAGRNGDVIKLDDGSLHTIACDKAGVCIFPNAGTNGNALSGGGQANIGPADSVTVEPGAGGSGCLFACRTVDKAGVVIVDEKG